MNDGTAFRLLDPVFRSLDEVERGTGRFGETTYSYRGRQVGHVHGDSLHIPFPKRIRDELLDENRVQKHPYHPDSGWIHLTVRTEEDRGEARRLIDRSYRLAREAKGSPS